MRGTDRPPERRSLEDTTAARLAEIVTAAERAAKQVIDDAEAEARRQLSDAEAEAARIVAQRSARFGEVTDRLAAQAESIQRQSEELIAELRRVKGELGVDPGPTRPDQAAAPGPASEPEAEPASRKSHLTAVTLLEAGPEPTPPPEPVAEVGDGPGERRAADPTPAGARLLATQMAVSGSSRQEIEQRLRHGFEIEDTSPILDAILGPEAS